MFSCETLRDQRTEQGVGGSTSQQLCAIGRMMPSASEVIAQARADSIRGGLANQGFTVVEGLSQAEAELVIQRFGEIVPQYGGQKIWRVARQAGSDDRYDSRNQKRLYPHTECYEYTDIPPRYLALYCVRQARCGGGQTLFTDSQEFLSTLTPTEVEQLASRRYKFVAAEGIKADFENAEADKPILDRSDPAHPYFRFSYNNIRFPEGDGFVTDMRDRIVQFCYDNNQPVLVPDNGLLIWDNQRMLHWRGGFEDSERLLLRYWVENMSSSA